MTLKEKLREQENVVFPAGKIVLLDGREIDCYPREKGCDCNVDYNNLEFDTTGRYLSFGKKGHQKDYIEELDVVLEKQLFIDNAFFLFQNRERIMQDSRMFFCSCCSRECPCLYRHFGLQEPHIGSISRMVGSLRRGCENGCKRHKKPYISPGWESLEWCQQLRGCVRGWNGRKAATALVQRLLALFYKNQPTLQPRKGLLPSLFPARGIRYPEYPPFLTYLTPTKCLGTSLWTT
jgi:hypothetical protein